VSYLALAAILVVTSLIVLFVPSIRRIND
jgi:hypothetical protein